MGLLEKRKILLFSLLLSFTLSMSTVAVLSIKSFIEMNMLTGKRVPFEQVVTGNGTGKMSGYFGWVINPGPSMLYVRVLSSADIHSIMLLANASGYKTLLVTEPAYYDPLPPRVVVGHNIILYPNNVSVGFTIIIREDGYITVTVSSNYYLRDDWMRIVFSKMLHDIYLPPNIISYFSLEVNEFVYLNRLEWNTYY